MSAHCHVWFEPYTAVNMIFTVAILYIFFKKMLPICIIPGQIVLMQAGCVT